MLEVAEVGSAVSRTEYEARVPDLRVDLINAQYDLRTADFPVLVLLTGDDRLAVNEVLNVLHEWMDARYLRTHAFGPPTQEERERPRFWRYWRALPGRGELALFVGAWARNAVAQRLRGELDGAGLDRRLEHIERLERTLVDDGTLLLKFFLHLPPREARRRIAKAAKDPDAAWRLDREDHAILERLDEAVPVVERLLRRTHAPDAPWHVVETGDARHRNLAVAETLLGALGARRDGARAAASPIPLPSPPPATSVLESVDLSAALPYDAYKRKLARAQARLGKVARRARDAGVGCVAMLEGWDAAGKGGVIRRITRALDARDYRVVPVAAPGPEARAHHWLWRFWRELPRPGRLLILDRSWYGRVLVERVEGLASPADWHRAYGEINDFEEQLVAHGIPVCKFWLHIDPDEQLRRFQAREKTPYKKYKIGQEDYRNRERWDDYVLAVNEMVARTSTPRAPWTLVPANDKRHARVQVLKAVARAWRRAVKAAH